MTIVNVPAIGVDNKNLHLTSAEVVRIMSGDLEPTRNAIYALCRDWLAWKPKGDTNA